ncbi:RrF2 family transcriptional regulator [Mucisphaera sp.]|uniref:RrF2 family transcriptional regulator n=1 Tax=Mucisphaera sp. TaxID=2913024 RepID=UPI003D0F647C
MLSLTKKSDYALVALSYLGLRWHDQSGPASARQVASAFELPLALLMNVFKDLASAGIVASTRGARGGYELAREPAAINLLEVFVALEGPIHLVDCCRKEDPETAPCRISNACPVQGPMRTLDKRLQGFFQSVSLQDLIEPEHTTAVESELVTLSATSSSKQPHASD